MLIKNKETVSCLSINKKYIIIQIIFSRKKKIKTHVIYSQNNNNNNNEGLMSTPMKSTKELKP